MHVVKTAVCVHIDIQHLAWRKKLDVDSVLEWEVPEVLLKYNPGGYFGEDKEGCPLRIEPIGLSDPKGTLALK